MTWFKVCDSFAAHRKVEALQAMPVATYTAAITIWTLMGSDCGLHLTDGVFSRVRARKVTGLPDKLLDAGLAALVKVGLFDREGEECAYHDWPSMQPTKAQVEAQRAAKVAAGRSGGAASASVRSKHLLRSDEAPASQNASTCLSGDEAEPKQPAAPRRTYTRASPDPTRPVPGEKNSDPSANGAGAPPATRVGPATRKAATKAAGPAEPLPFTIAAALSAIATASDGRFTAPIGDELHPRHLRPLTALIRAVPDLDAWARVGRWLAAGALLRRPDLTVAWLLTSDAHTAARGWEESGAPNLGRTPNLLTARAETDEADAQVAVIERARAEYRANNPGGVH